MSDVPTLAEIGLPKAQYQFLVGAFAPAKTPKPIIERLNREVVAALHVKEIADKIAALGGSPMPMTPAEFERVRAEGNRAERGNRQGFGLRAAIVRWALP